MEKNSAIYFTRPGVAELRDEVMPEAGPGQVLVRLVRSCISSGTERANLMGVPDNATSIYSTAPEGVVTWPRQAGYSSSGVVVATGEGVKSVAVGDRVALSWSLHRRFVVLDERLVYRLPEGVSFEAAAWTHIATFPMAAIRKCRLEMGESALVMGQGVLGQLAVKLLRAAGATPVIAADPLEMRRSRAGDLGADWAVDPTAPDFAETVRDLTDWGRMAQRGRVREAGAKVVIEVTGSGSALEMALEAIAPCGRMALLGCTRGSDFSVDYYHKVHGRGVTLVGAHTNARPDGESSPGWWTERDDGLAFLRLLALKRVSLEGFTDEVQRPEACAEVFGRLAAGGAFPNVQFDWDA